MNPASATAPSLGAAATDGPSPTPQIPGYTIIGQLGEGGMGAVYLAEDAALGRRVAIKVISRRMTADVQSKARFLREARTLATIEHPHVVRVYSFGEIDGQPYLVMEYVEGETLADRIARLGRLGVEEATRITRDIIDALDAAWEKKVIHRDIKPSNILIDRRNRVRVADFGLAKPISLESSDASLTGTGLMVGTPHYISPEQAQGQDADFRSDFYSVGVLLYHMLTGERPFEGATPFAIVAKQMHQAMPALHARRGDVPPELERLTQWLGQKEAGKRPSSHAQLLAAIDGLIVHTPSAPMPSFATMAIEPPKNRWRAAGVALLLLLVIAAATILYVRLNPTVKRAPEAARPADKRFVVAVAPFYGPDDDSTKEGRLMAAMIERAVATRLGPQNANVLGIEETKSPVRNDESARELGTRLRADAVIWGEAFALRNETEIQPHVTLITALKRDAAQNPIASDDARLFGAKRSDPTQILEGAGAAPLLKLQSEAPNQIELRKTSASGIGDLVLVLAGIHALENERNPRKAIGFFEQTPETSETLRYRVQALLMLDDKENALPLLERAVPLEPADAPSQALRGDLYLTAGRVPDAIAAYAQAASIGQPYTTTRGILYGGRLYRTETYRSHLQPNDEIQTNYLLAVDSTSLRVVGRHAMPGPPALFRTDGGALVIECNIAKGDGPKIAEIRLREGRFDRVLWPPTSLMTRMQSMKAGRVPVANFIEALEAIPATRESPPPFVVRKDKFTPGLPATLPDLERHLREAAQRDPTQPWNLFFLAVALREQKRTAEANAVIAELARRDDPGIPYYEFTWMLNHATRIRAYEWDVALWSKIQKQRRLIPQPPDFGTLIERLISASFFRMASKIPDRERGYEALRRVRALALTPEGEDLVAAVWAKHFEKSGDPRARDEWEIVRRVHAHPFNFAGATAKIDYALTAAAAGLVGFIGLFVIVAINAYLRSRRLPEPPTKPSVLLPWNARFLALPRLARVGAITLAAALLGLGVLFLIAQGQGESAFIVFVVIALPLLVIRLFRIRPRRLITAITAQERRALAVAWALLLVTGVFLTDRILLGGELWSFPVGLADTIGHPKIVADFEKRIEERGDGDPALRYAVAVVNHYAGNKNRAHALYTSLPAGYANSVKNREALAAGRMPAASLTADELFRGWTGTRPQRWRKVVDVKELFIQGPVIILGTLLSVGLLLLALVFLSPPPAAVEDPGLTRIGKIVGLLVPGAYDVRRGHPWRALTTLVLAGAVLLPLGSWLTRDAKVPAVGPLSAISLPAIEGTFPLPDVELTPAQRMTMLFAYPNAKLFFALLAAAALGATALHLARVRRIVREPVAPKEPAVAAFAR